MKGLHAIVLCAVLLGGLVFVVGIGNQSELKSAQTIESKPNIAAMRACSVLVESNNGFGSGVMSTHDGTTYVWTAGHLVKDIPHDSEIFISQEHYDGTRTVGKIKFLAKVLHNDPFYDLALLQVDQQNFTGHTVRFNKENVPEVGTAIWHVGTLYRKNGQGSVTAGIMSKLNTTRSTGFPGDQVNVGIAPGSSGGGVFLRDGTCLGLVLEGSATVAFIIPAREIRKCAEAWGCAWAVTN